MKDIERDLWLIVFGAALADKKFRTSLKERLTVHACPSDYVAEFVKALQADDAAAMWKWWKFYYLPATIEKQEKPARWKLLDSVVERLNGIIFRRESLASVRRAAAARLDKDGFSDWLVSEGERLGAMKS